MIKFLLCASVVVLATSSPATAAFVIDTGTPVSTINTNNWVLAPNQSLAGQFTLGTATQITSVEGFINGSGGSDITVTIYSDGPLPSSANALFSASFASTASANPGLWQGVSGQTWNLAAGNYWVGFASNGPDGMIDGAPSPLSAYAFTLNGDWVNSPLNFGVRIAGDSVINNAVPESSTWAMMILGFGLVGGMMRRRVTKVSYA